MNYVTADQGMLARLSGLVEPVEIRDPDGKVLGRYVPTLSPGEAEVYARAQELFDREEIERRKREEHARGVTTEELLKRLQSLGTPG